MSRYLPQEIVANYKKTSNPECHHPYYSKWNSLPFTERLHMVRMECSAINKHPRMKYYDIIATPYLNDYRHHKYGTWAGKICVSIYFHGNPDKPYDINTVCNIGHLPVCYGTLKDKEKLDEWKSQLEELDI
tara:strand:+ start:282 stop:674 length:393 start_codon:yes stop_codon:yes gene_type:complete